MNQLVDQLQAASTTEPGVAIAHLAGALRHDVVRHVPGDHPLAGDHQGNEHIAAFLRASRSTTTDDEHIELVERDQAAVDAFWSD